MPKLDANIYGSDNNGFAQAVASDALDVETPGMAIADYWGDIQDTARAQSFANVGRESLAASTPDTPTRSRSVDIEKLAGYRTGKTTEGHHTGQSQSPEFDKAPGKSGGPKYSGLTDKMGRES